jgi:hypothetical protein
VKVVTHRSRYIEPAVVPEFGAGTSSTEIKVSAFWTCEDPQPTSEFVAACPCPDGLMQDEHKRGNEAYIILHRGARSRGYKRRERERERASARERERGFGLEVSCLS